MSVIPAMKEILESNSGSMVEVEDALSDLLTFCEETGIELEAEDLDEAIEEAEQWLAEGDLTEAERAQLAEFMKAIKKLAFKGARAVGKVHNAYKKARHAVKSFGQGVRNSARAGYAAGHKKPKRTIRRPGQKKPMGGGKKPKKPPGAKANRPKKPPGATKPPKK